MSTPFVRTLVAATLLAAVGGPALAQAGHGHHPSAQAAVAASRPADQPAFADGVVRRVHAATGSVTMAHGPLPHLDMPPMTMVFKLVGKASLDGLSVGDRVRFVADREGGTLVINRIDKLPN